jgi:succinate-semialdehyde dehydrogenase/glutarate-semialdehyde dehydrogenase
MGKPVAESEAEIAYAAEFFRWNAEEAVRIAGRYQVNQTGKGRVLTLKQPVGPALMITPWNFPMAMGTARSAGRRRGVHDRHEAGQADALSMLALARILEEAGLPPGSAQRHHGRRRRARSWSR